MEYQCLYANDLLDENGFYIHHKSKRGQRPRPTSKANFYTQEDAVEDAKLSVRLLQLTHIDPSTIVVEDSVLTATEVVKSLSVQAIGDDPLVRIILSPPREVKKDEYGRLARFNPEAVNPFEGRLFYRLVDALDFHKACLWPGELGQVSAITSPANVFSLYFETYSYRSGWYKLSLSYHPTTMTTSAFIHNLSISDTKIITSKLLSDSTQLLSIHPLLLPTLVIELLFKNCIKDLTRIFGQAISTQQSLGLTSARRFAHFRDLEADNEAAANRSFGDGQNLAGLEERMEFTMMAGRKILDYFDELENITPDGAYRNNFIEAGKIVKNRLTFFIDGLELQMPRLRRAKAHTELNQTGLENRTSSDANKISQQIALESKADSTAMKAIAVLTMFFLPATFVAAFFAMPLFDWSAPHGSEVVNSRFWIYWVVTVPGTLIVLGVWRVWWIFEQWKQAREQNVDDQNGGLMAFVMRWFNSWWKKNEVATKASIEA